MSENKKVTEQNEEKVMTRYDRKIQKRKEQKEKQKKEQKRSKVIGIAVIVVLVCLIAYFPIRSYQVTHNTYIMVGNEPVTELEFDYRYNTAMNNYISQYNSIMTYYGVDLSQDLSKQMYSGDMSWKDLFEQLAVGSIIQRRAMLAEIEATGFTYDTTEDYEMVVQSMEEIADELGLTLGKYVKQLYGSYATLDRISEYLKEDLVVTAFYNQVATEKAPTEDEILAHYEAYKDSYDSVDYRMTTIEADLPTDTTPTAEEIDKAMADAKVLAEGALETVELDGDSYVNMTFADCETITCDWLFDPGREYGDTTIVEDTANNLYYVLAFEKRYLDDNPTADIRMILSQDKTGEEILNEWKSGAATEESFIELCNQYAISGITSTDGLYENVSRSEVPDALAVWLYDQERAEGDTTTVVTEDGFHYVVYFLAKNDPTWKQNASNIVLEEKMEAYVEELSANIEVEDPKGRLNYLTLESANESEATESTEAEEASQAE